MSELSSIISGTSEPNRDSLAASTIKTEPEDDKAAELIKSEHKPLFAGQRIKFEIEIDCKDLKSEIHTEYETKEIQVKEEPTSPVHQPVSNIDVPEKVVQPILKQPKRTKQTKNTKPGSSKSKKKQQPCGRCKKDPLKEGSSTTSTAAQEGVKPGFFQCDICKKIFISKTVLKDHLLVHSKRTCKFCGKQYSLENHLNKHLHTKHYLSKDSKIEYGCTYCAKKFETEVSLTEHMAIHSDKCYMCEVCDKKFTFKGNLKKHALTHKGAEGFTCNYCLKKFCLKRNWKNHVITHRNNTRPSDWLKFKD